jgi:hypothetical protein
MLRISAWDDDLLARQVIFFFLDLAVAAATAHEFVKIRCQKVKGL